MYSFLIKLLILFTINSSVDGSYRYVGCYSVVFYDSYFTSSFMEPTLCFRLCDTSMIYLRSKICRCSGGGIMHYEKQSDDQCSIPCTKPVDRSAETPNKCGGPFAYSAFAMDKFYSQHGHLFDYRITFASCELWKTSDVYDVFEQKLAGGNKLTSLNKLELCAAACLDQNLMTGSLGFHDDDDKCLCILPLKPNKAFERSHYIQLLPNSSCDLYCNNTYEGAQNVQKFQCGSTKNTQIWAIYNLSDSCPTNYVYVKELKKCVYTYRGLWASCTPPGTSFTFDGSVLWSSFVKTIERLKLNHSAVNVDFDDTVVVDPEWKCLSIQSSTSSWTQYEYYGARSRFGSDTSRTTKRYILEDGCLVETSYSSFTSRYAHRLCVTDPINQYASSTGEAKQTYITAINPIIKYCPTNWFDVNRRCYRISEERKTIEQARNACISEAKSTQNTLSSSIWLPDKSGDVIGGNELSDTPKGIIVDYSSLWQARIGFFLLDTDPDHDNSDTDTTTSLTMLYYDDVMTPLNTTSDVPPTKHSAIHEFMVVQSVDEQNSTCAVITRKITEEYEKPVIQVSTNAECSRPRHVLCETNPLVVQKFQYGCFEQPKVLDLPSLVSNRLTHELCLSVCQELQTKLAILQINKCYCINGAAANSFNLTVDFPSYQRKVCGKPCPGNSYEMCGNDNTVIVFQILDYRRFNPLMRTLAQPYPSYIFDSCISLSSINQTTVYQFQIINKYDFHPRYCLAFCSKYEQKYALLNDKECLCTNQPMKGNDTIDEITVGQDCSQPCTGNYFYSCGNKKNVTIYSMYLLQPKCEHGFEVAQNDEQCVYSHYSSKTNSLESAIKYCESIGSKLAKINDVIEIQDILPDSILHTKIMQQLILVYRIQSVIDTRYYWIDRTTDTPHSSTISERLLAKCSKEPESSDRNCIKIQYASNSERHFMNDKRCITEANECSNVSAMPICVDRHIEPKPSTVPPITDDNPADVSVEIVVDYSCDDANNEYHFVEDYCYKVYSHELSWKDAQAECQRDNAVLFVPEKATTIQFVKGLFLRQKTYTSSGYAHVGVYYDTSNRTVIQYNLTAGDKTLTVPDSNSVYDVCEKTFQERYTALMSSTNLPSSEKALLKTQQIGCAYIDMALNSAPIIRCDEIPCKRTAVVICQKSPITKKTTIAAKRVYVDEPSPSEESTSLPSSTIVKNMKSTSPATNQSEDGVLADSDTTSVARDFAPIFLLLVTICILLLLAFVATLYHHRDSILHRAQRHTTNSIYSQLTSANEFDLN